ncbi:MAG TPA: NADH-quinone oxidoreductase subunit C [Elusimicrobiales bacterium]|nr:NADH-quinone oxidoreductase subunit C [Elusimicrobiales bacterium]
MTMDITQLAPQELPARVSELAGAGARLVQISAVALPVTAAGETPAVELTYSFDKNGALSHQRLLAAPGGKVPSVSGVYFPAFLYENEIHEQFGVDFEGMAVDFKGTLYKTAVRVPFAVAAPVKKTPPPANPGEPQAK